MPLTDPSMPGLVFVPGQNGNKFQVAPSAIQDPALRNQVMLRQLTSQPAALPDAPADAAVPLQPNGIATPMQTTVRTSTKEIPGARQLAKQIGEGIKAQGEAQVKAMDVDAQMLRDQAKANEMRNEMRNKFLADEENIAKVKDDALKDTSDKIRGIREEMRAANVDPNRLFKGNTGASIGAAIAAGIGAYTSALTGGPNGAMQIIQTAIDRDIDAQKSAIQKKTADYQFAVDEQNMVKAKFSDEASQRKAQFVLRLEAVDQKLADMETVAKSQKIQHNIGAMRASVQQEIAKNAYDLAAKSAGETVTETVLGGSSKAAALTDAQSNAAIFGDRMMQAEADMKKLSQAGYNRASYGESVVSSFLPGPLKPEQTKMQDQAELNFLSAVLRKESGAAISDSEMENGQKQYFPRAGDSQAVIAQKTANREIAIKGMIRAAGPGAASMQTTQADPFAAYATPR